MSFENGVFVPHPAQLAPDSSSTSAGAGGRNAAGVLMRDRDKDNRQDRGWGREGRRERGNNDSPNWRSRERDGDGGGRGFRGRRNEGRNQGQVMYHGNQRIPSLMDCEENGDNNGDNFEQSQQQSLGPGFSFNPDAPTFEPYFPTSSTSSSTNSSQSRPFFNEDNRNKNKNQNPKPSFVHGRGDGKLAAALKQQSTYENSGRNGRKQNPNEKRMGVKERQHFGRSSKKSSSTESAESNLNSEESELSLGSKQPDIRNQRERLSDQLSRNACECMVCVERVDRSQRIWSCTKCFNIFHLNCVSTWANSSKDEIGWRCPGCQSYCEEIPSEYRCFCSRVKNPVNNRTETPHTCGEMCGRKGPGGINCSHYCTILCHPGPCPKCEQVESRNCCCGKIQVQVKCSSKAVLTCSNVCDKLLNCGVHKCSKQCHGGDCDPCAVVLKLECHCKSQRKEQLCDSDLAGVLTFSCDKKCSQLLQCKNHTCEDKCHAGLCKPCKLSPEAVLSCPCGQTPVEKACLVSRVPPRKTCLDPIPVCGKVCGKIFVCGNVEAEHRCKALCHSSQCPTCLLVTFVKCRCGSKTFEISCSQYNPSKQYTCEKRCTKKRSCGKHKCNLKCCDQDDHICPIVCDRALRCGNHKCSFLCHNGHCPPCRVVSFDELSCECGASVIYPPVSCGTKPPLCTQPCTRVHDCDHPVMHNCHSEAQCPPCTFLTKRKCHGEHEERKNVMCHIKEFSCGMPCKKRLSCGRHNCIRTCHPGECFADGECCKLPCEIAKVGCGHACGMPCHDGECPESKCKIVSDVVCPCGRRKDTMICWKREREYDRLVIYLMNIELKQLRDVDPNSKEPEKEIDAAVVLSQMKARTPKSNVLECDKECTRVERNRKMMEALQLEDPDATSTFGTPNYSDFLLSFAKKSPQFVENVHDRLTQLVVKAKRSKRKNETYGFESMNRDKRRVVHEYSDHFGCLSESFDEEPNRNVVCTASKDKSYLPAVSLVDAVFRPNICSERKNAFNDVEIFQNSKSQIMRPANGKMWTIPSATSRMVPLAAQTSAPPTMSTPSFSNPSSNNNSSTSTASALPVFGGDFPPLS